MNDIWIPFSWCTHTILSKIIWLIFCFYHFSLNAILTKDCYWFITTSKRTKINGSWLTITTGVICEINTSVSTVYTHWEMIQILINRPDYMGMTMGGEVITEIKLTDQVTWIPPKLSKWRFERCAQHSFCHYLQACMNNTRNQGVITQGNDPNSKSYYCLIKT